jgi:hypothetical protein
MTLLLLLALLAGWVMLDVSICFYIEKKIKNRWISWPLVSIIFPLILVFPVSDELIAKRKFEKLCAAEETSFKPVIVNAENRDLLQVSGGSSGMITDTPLEIRFSESIFLDLATREEVLRFKVYSVKGGRLIHFLGVSNSDSPLTMDPSSCVPKKFHAILGSFRIVR